MTERLVYPRVIALGKSTHEPVDKKRADLHAWLVGKLTGETARVVPHNRTIHISSDALVERPEELSRWITRSQVDDAEAASTLILDLSGNLYDMLRELVIFDLAKFAEKWTAAIPGRTAVILLPSLPARRASIFWPALKVAETGRRVVVLANDGSMWTGRDVDPGDRQIGDDYASQLAELASGGRTDLRPLMFKELGHFPITDGADLFCARYFLHADLAKNDIARRLAEEIGELGPTSHPLVIFTHGAHSVWLHEAGLLAGGRLPQKPPAYDITDVADVRAFLMPEQKAVVVFDVVNSGSTCSRVIKHLRESGVALVSTVFAVIRDRDTNAVELPDGIVLTELAKETTGKVRRDDCVQCRELKLPFTPPLSPDYTCRSYDMWELLLAYKWPAETYGPHGIDFLSEAPDMGKLFEEFGGWIAHKISLLVPADSAQKDIAFICPEETHINKLVKWLSARLHDQIVVVRIPRQDISSFSAVSENSAADGWRSQLEHLSSASRTHVVVVDEFNGSSATASALVTILRHYHVEPDLYVPVLNRDPDVASKLGIPVKPLYEIPSPRRR